MNGDIVGYFFNDIYRKLINLNKDNLIVKYIKWIVKEGEKRIKIYFFLKCKLFIFLKE